MLIESSYAISLFNGSINVCPSVAILEIEMCMTLNLTLEISKVKCKYAICSSITCACPICFTILQIFAVEMCLTLTLTLERSKVKFKSSNRKRICDFIFDGNNNVCLLFHRFREIHIRRCAWPWPWPLECVKVKWKTKSKGHMRIPVLAIAKLPQSVTVCETITFIRTSQFDICRWKSRTCTILIKKMPDKTYLSTGICMQKLVLLVSAVCSRWTFSIHTYWRTQYLW